MKLRSALEMLFARRPGGTALAVGTMAPDFEALAHTGERIRLSALRGQRVLLWFYPKADTPGCTTEGCGFRDRKAEYVAAKVHILGVSFDSPAENRAFAEKFGFDFPLLCDTNREIGMLYGACDDPRAGYPRRISYLIGKGGLIERAWDPVKVTSHPAQILTELGRR